MKKATIQKIHDTIQKENKNADALIAVCNNNDDITVSAQGDINRVGQAIFASLFDNDNQDLASGIYMMIKNITYNLIKMPSPYAEDMKSMFLEQFGDKSNNTECQIIQMPQGEA